jgi:hypothetical protein
VDEVHVVEQHETLEDLRGPLFYPGEVQAFELRLLHCVNRRVRAS